jgi:hypothetical protein
MRIAKFIILLVFLPLFASFFLSCRDDGFDTNPNIKLSFSADTLLFDTVFTTVGSSTRFFMVYNNHNKRINISSINLGWGNESFFRINVDGRSGTQLRDIEIGANDSIYVFVEVTLDPVNQSLPLIIADSIVFNINSNSQAVKLVAWGQDANFIYPNFTSPSGVAYHLISENTVWTADLPYVVYGLAVVAPNATLTINEGARVHLHNNASLVFLAESTFKVNGTADHPVKIQGDRLESFFSEVPGQWGRIYLSPTSKDHEINYAVIKNGSVGLHVDSIGSVTSPTLQIRNSIIKNMSMVGILAQGSHLVAENTVVANCGEHLLYLAIGGKYNFKHCTFANYFNLPNTPLRQTPSVLLNNYYFDNTGVVQIRELEEAFFGNCIIYGSIQEELFIDLYTGSEISYTFDHCLIRTQRNTFDPSFVNVLTNSQPQFRDVSLQAQDYRLKQNSPAIGAGNPDIAFSVPFDILGLDRTQRADIGAYQYQVIEEEK